VAITPPSDIVLGVVLAADPQKYQAAAERLRRLSSATLQAASAPAASAPAAEGAGAASIQDGAAEASGSTVAMGDASSGKARVVRKTKDMGEAFGQLEAFVLQSFIQSMLPKNATSVFGKGTAGEVWKSMMAEKLGAEIARSGQVGIAKRLAGAQALALAGRGPALASGLDSAASAGGLAPPGRMPSSLTGVLPYLQPPPMPALPEPIKPGSADPAKRS
jgi:peptidoglycan hydrolase FlgJ